MKEAIEQSLAILRGMGVTLRHILKERRVTIQYPEERPPQAFRYRGIHQLRLDEQGKELCVGCNLCGLACPSECIYVEAAECSPEEAEHVSHYERYARVRDQRGALPLLWLLRRGVPDGRAGDDTAV